jgi:hypothetical protein
LRIGISGLVSASIFGRAECYHDEMKGKTDKAVENIDAILEGHFSSLPPRERARRERAFINAAKKIDVRAKQREQPKNADRPGEARRHA